MKKQFEEVKCIYCLGKGTVLRRVSYTLKQKNRMISLHKKGKSYREICGIMGIDHPFKVQYQIDRYFNRRPRVTHLT